MNSLTFAGSRSILESLRAGPGRAAHETIDDMGDGGDLHDRRAPLRPDQADSSPPGNGRPSASLRRSSSAAGSRTARPGSSPGKALADHLAGRGGAASQYGVKDVSVHRFKPSSPDKTDGRRGIHPRGVPDGIGRGRLRSILDSSDGAPKRPRPPWPSPMRSASDRAVLVKGYAYVEIRAKGLERAELERLAAAAAGRIGLPSEPPPPGIVRLPRADLIPGSERYIKGDIAAGAESPLLEPGFLGFPGGNEPGLCGAIRPRRQQAHRRGIRRSAGGAHGTRARALQGIPRGRPGRGRPRGRSRRLGRHCLFRVSGKIAVLIIGEPDRATADARLLEALADSPIRTDASAAGGLRTVNPETSGPRA